MKKNARNYMSCEILADRPVEVYMLFRGFGFFKLRNFPDIDDKLITVRRVDGHSQTHRLLVTIKGSPVYFIHRDPAVRR